MESSLVLFMKSLQVSKPQKCLLYGPKSKAAGASAFQKKIRLDNDRPQNSEQTYKNYLCGGLFTQLNSRVEKISPHYYGLQFIL